MPSPSKGHEQRQQTGADVKPWWESLDTDYGNPSPNPEYETGGDQNDVQQDDMLKIESISKKILGDTITPVSIFLKVRDRFANSVLLESSDYHGSDNMKWFQTNNNWNICGWFLKPKEVKMKWPICPHWSLLTNNLLFNIAGFPLFYISLIL